MAAATYHLRTLSPKYGQTGKEKPLYYRKQQFAAKWPKNDHKVSNEKHARLIPSGGGGGTPL